MTMIRVFSWRFVHSLSLFISLLDPSFHRYNKPTWTSSPFYLNCFLLASKTCNSQPNTITRHPSESDGPNSALASPRCGMLCAQNLSRPHRISHYDIKESNAKSLLRPLILATGRTEIAFQQIRQTQNVCIKIIVPRRLLCFRIGSTCLFFGRIPSFEDSVTGFYQLQVRCPHTHFEKILDDTTYSGFN